ncbi:hemerythrin [Acidovorax carolinensis]|uniref:Hemerythrin n=1 Tax=Acidovorax carolinensis TaxID=553814 RepID=A0A240U8J3_9BURK|nr:hemerythrin domain-containing protein [Acidovorax carolinensis]ART56227.1 hemerythrin [Acidovorax carolinensis]ART57827.1 hemerythrin [Acidovorax carolinensis]
MATPSALPGFNAPAVGFEQPFAMLEACHERVQRTLTLLQRLRTHVQEHGADVPAQQAARDVLRYFDIAAPLHHEDEELHVFPLLLAKGAPDVAALVARLQHDHLCMTADWAAARLPLQALADGLQAVFSEADGAAFDRFIARYDRHIADEETVAYPAAQALLAAPALEAMGSEMAARRKVPASAR